MAPVERGSLPAPIAPTSSKTEKMLLLQTLDGAVLTAVLEFGLRLLLPETGSWRSDRLDSLFLHQA